jgi:LmbE family N-acetylglucosaminyl deacetylase
MPPGFQRAQPRRRRRASSTSRRRTTSIDRKLAAIAVHTSQFPAAFVEARREVARTVGHTHGVEYGEVYEVLRVGL